MVFRRSLVLGAALLGIAHTARSQGTRWDENWVGSEWEVYARSLADRGLIADQPWSIRPFAPRVIDAWSANSTTRQPWAAHLGPPTGTEVPFHILRPSLTSSYNSGFAWGYNDGPVWQGRGLNVWATGGATFRYGHFSARFEPIIEYAQNQAFRLDDTVAGAANRYVDRSRSGAIDLPQRFGDYRYTLLDPGQSYIRADFGYFGGGLSTENIFWGPGIRHAILFDANAGGFPHVFLGTNTPLVTPIGRFHGQIIYGRLEESAFAPPSVSPSRFGAGLVGVWMPPHQPIEVGFARFYHRAWRDINLSLLRVPFGGFLGDPQQQADDKAFGSGIPDNQLLSFWSTIRVPAAGLEVFGEFGRNDRGFRFRDIEVEPEHNAAFLVGFLETFAAAPSGMSFWTIRAEYANARIAALQNIGRLQSTFYDHSPITQGHTERGQILGSILMDQSGGLEASLDKWTPRGRAGFQLMERQLPGTRQVGMPDTGGRSQWDFGFSLTAFVKTWDVSVQAGHVFDFNRFTNDLVNGDGSNNYLRVSARAGVPHLR